MGIEPPFAIFPKPHKVTFSGARAALGSQTTNSKLIRIYQTYF
jgi:hypothetical protein